MKFGRTFDRLLRYILHADPTLGPVKMFQQDVLDAFYRLLLALNDITKLAMILPVSLYGDYGK